MQNIDVHFNATDNFKKTAANISALEAKVAALNNTFRAQAYASPPAVVDTPRWKNASRAIHEASNAYRNAASSSGLLTTQQIRATSEAEKYTKALQKQQLTFSEMRRSRGVMKQAYHDQLRYQRMTAQYWGTDSAGRAITDMTIPKNVPRELDTVAQKTYFLGQAMKSASTQVINMGKNMQWAGRQLTVGFTYPVALFGAAAGVMAYKVESAMTRVAKVYDVSAAAQNNEVMRTKELNEVRSRSFKLAEDTAKSYGMSIEDTLEIEERLAATGKRGDFLFKSTKEVSRIATLGDLDIGQSTDMTVALQGAFKDTIKTGDDLAETFNYMNAVENATSLSLQDIAEATPRAAAGLASLGVDAREMTVLLVAMREAGVRAAEGANALKTAGSRILNKQILNKATEEYKAAGADIDLVKISQEADANFLKFVQLLGKAEEKYSGMDEWQKKSARSALFGAHQYSRLSAVIANVNDETGQAGKAMRLLNVDQHELAEDADREIAQKMENVSGRFKTAWESLRGDLAEMGIPFLEVATKILEAAGVAAEWFNSLSDSKKRMFMVAAAVAAIAGPVVMLGGLFANLAGQFIRLGANGMTMAARLAGAVGLVTKEQQTATLSARAQNEAMMNQQVTTSTLAAETRVLAAAYKEATAAALVYLRQISGPAKSPTYSSPIGPQLPVITGAGLPKGGTQLSAAEMQAFYGNSFYGKTQYPGTSDTTVTGMKRSNKSRLIEARQAVTAQDKLNAKAAQEAKIRQKSTRLTNAGALGTAAMAGSMVLMMGTSNEVANNIGKWLMIGTFVVPAVGILLKSAKSLVVAGKGYVATQAAATALAWQNTRANMANVGYLRGASIAGRGMLAGFSAMMGPVGWIALGVTAIGAGLFAWKNHLDNIKEAQKQAAKNQAALVNSTDKWAESAGKAVKNYKTLANLKAPLRDREQENEAYKFYSSDEYEGEMKAFEGMSPDDQSLTAQNKYIELIKKYGLSVKEAKINMIGFYRASGKGALEAARKAGELADEFGNLKNTDMKGPLTESLKYINRETLKLSGDDSAKGVKALGKQWGDMFAREFLGASVPESRELFQMIEREVMAPWEDMRQKMLSSGQFDPNSEMLKSAKSLQEVWNSLSEDQRATMFSFFEETEAGTRLTNTRFLEMGDSVNRFERNIVRSAGEAVGLGDEVKTLADLMADTGFMAQTLTYKEAVKTSRQLVNNLLEAQMLSDVLNPSDNVDTAQFQGPFLEGDLPSAAQKFSAALSTIEPKALQQIETSLNYIADARGIKQGSNALETYNNIMNNVSKGTGKAKNKTKELGDALKNLKDRTVSIKIKQVGGIVQDAMSNVQSSMAESAMNQFNDGWDRRLEAAQDSWDARQDALQASHEAAQRGMERSQENAQDAFENRWERRREAIEKTYDRRAKAVDNAIKREQRADEIRQRLFEKEKNRLQRLADITNTNIDFNTQLNEGKLDEAAKTLNNAAAKSAIEQMEAEERAAERRTQAKIEKLEKKNERLEKQRDRELKSLEKLEERMRKHLERVQDARRRALEKQQAQEVKALEKSQEAAMDALDEQREYEEATLQQRLDLFLAYTARNKKDLERWMKELGFKYDDFGKNVKKKGQSWAKSIRTSMLDEIRAAGLKVMNDNLWEKVGKSMGNKLIKGLGFSNLKEFNRFVRTGTRGGGRSGGRKGNSASGALVGASAVETRHEGGVIGTGGGSRGNIPNTFKGLHRSEKMVRAQRGEYVVNKESSKKHLDVLNAINHGGDVPMGGGSDSGYGGPAALMSVAAAKLWEKGVSYAFDNAYAVGLAKERRRQAMFGSSFTGKSGEFGGRLFSASQMKNAATIASVGSGMGMSKRDIMIGIMTAIAESGLVNVNYGDRDSLGLFQQRPSMGWGSPAQVTDPEYASKKFFSVLKAHGERDEESPWMAAQHVQRSAFADGSNYQVWWDAARAIMNSGLKREVGPGGVSGYVPGSGGRHRPINAPVTSGLHGGSTFGNPPAVDMAVPRGRPVYAVADGVVTSSKDIPGPLSSDTYRGSGPYGSFGRMVQMQTDSGAGILFAHLSRRSVRDGQRVRGGSVVGYSGNTGNSSGPHLHFGATNGPYAWLRRGGEIKYDNTQVVAHRGETMLSAPVTRQLKENVANGGSGDYNVTIDLRGAYIKEDVDIKKAVNSAIDERESKLGRRRTVN